MKRKLILLSLAAMLLLTGFGIGRQSATDRADEARVVGLNHVGLRVSDFEAAVKFYEHDLGFPMTYKFNDASGKPIFAYFQINKSTFIELLPANEQRPEGIDHFGLEARNIASMVNHLHGLGIQSSQPSESPYTRVKLAHVEDVNGIYFELIEAVDGSELRRVMDNWKE
ncbi:VOC family protein [Robiginitalea sp. SC105]|uniref:VOC family protein n=1 Tax=Robiginitalea sp. SC105 TaxID=2762332 RepID=UPI00163B2368|nr:VOC family protein [Robiginitalea sp. SC105]MBC2838598.1 VOC family protein [Robiginitalea sp. SC105]